VEDTGIATELRANGYKLTRQRLAVVRVLAEANEHFTASQVLELARAVYPGIGLTTVYRTLEVLSELGFVRRVHLEGQCHAYAPVREREGHYLVCQSCHRVVDFPCTGLPELVERTARETGFAVESHLVELVGLCPACQSTSVAAASHASGHR
jgi:Fur family ferric uptake transcriptional regulator